MTKEFYRTGQLSLDHNTYGGELSLFDFEGHHTLQSMANRIAHDLRFDGMCKQNTLNKTRNKGYKKGLR